MSGQAAPDAPDEVHNILTTVIYNLLMRTTRQN